MQRWIATSTRSMPEAAPLKNAEGQGAHRRDSIAALLRQVIPCDDVARMRLELPAGPGSSRIWTTSGTHDGGAPAVRHHQLGLLTQVHSGVGDGWLLTRAGTRFSDHDAQTAALLLPLLTVYDGRRTRAGEPETTAEGLLTRTELRVLRLVSLGLTARQISRTVGAAEPTVRKHLEHAYRKLGCHDRLSAVMCAQRRGLL